MHPYIQRIYSNSILEEHNPMKDLKELIFIEPEDRELTRINRQDMRFTYNDIKDYFEDIMTNWFKVVNRLEPILELLSLLKTRLNIENEFLLICQAIEGLHSRFFELEEKSTYRKKEKNSYGQASFATRIKSIINRANKLGTNKLSRRLDTSKIKNTRDYYTHLFINQKDIYTNTELLIVINDLTAILYVLIFKLIHVPEKNILDFINKHRSFSSFDITEIPIAKGKDV